VDKSWPILIDLTAACQLTGYESVVRGYTVFFPFADLLAQIVGFLDVSAARLACPDLRMRLDLA